MLRKRSDDVVIARAERAMARTRRLMAESERLRRELAQQADRTPAGDGGAPRARQPEPPRRRGEGVNP